MIDFLHVKR